MNPHKNFASFFHDAKNLGNLIGPMHKVDPIENVR